MGDSGGGYTFIKGIFAISVRLLLLSCVSDGLRMDVTIDVKRTCVDGPYDETVSQSAVFRAF
jgi:hypothetical protein